MATNQENSPKKERPTISTVRGKVTEPVHGTAPDPTDFTPPLIEDSTPVSTTIPVTPRVESDEDSAPVTHKAISLDDLRQPDPDEMKPLDLSTLPKKEPDGEENSVESQFMGDLENAVEREKESISERIGAITEMQHKEFIEQVSAEADATEETASVDVDNIDLFEDDGMEPDHDVAIRPNESIAAADEELLKPDNIPFDTARSGYDDGSAEIDYPELKIDEDNLFKSIDEDLLAETGEETPTVDSDAMLEKLKQDVKKNIVPVHEKIDLEKFTVSKEAVSAARINFIQIPNKADWVLPAANKVIRVSALSGPEIFALQPRQNDAQNRINAMKDMYAILYRHIVSEKPSFVQWMKETPFSDLDHIYFALHKATFADSNYTYYECPKCHEVFLTDHSFDDMVKYKDDATKEAIEKLLQNGIGDSKPAYNRYQISDDYVIDTHAPSIYSTIEIASLSNKFIEKYNDLLDVLTCISAIYKIDRENMSLIPIDTELAKDSMTKTVAHRISIFSNILNQLPSDNFIDLRAYISTTYLNQEEKITYCLPAVKCSKCETEIPEQEMDGSSLLFLRHQLGAFGTI